MSRRILGVWLGVAACAAPMDPGPPPFGEEHTFGLWLVGPPQQRQLIAFDPAAPIFPARATLLEGWLVGLGYAGTTLEAQGLSAGAQALVPDGRPLPTPDRRVRWTPDGWREEPPDLTGLEAVRLRPITAADCRAAGRCLDGLADLCRTCEVDPQAVVAPIPPAPPEPLQALCLPGWRQAGPEDRPACAPDPVGPCEGAALALLGDQRCGPIGASCPAAGEFPPPNSGRTIHVREGATDGDGSRAAPLGRLEDAIAFAGPGDRIALAAGHYRAAEIPAAVEVVGACAEQVVLQGTSLRLAGGTLRDLRLEVPLVITGTSTLASIHSRQVSAAGINVGPGAVLHAQRLWIEGARGGGLVLSGAQAQLDQVKIDAPANFGVWISGSTVSLQRAAIDLTSPDPAIIVRGGHLRATAFSITGSFGVGILGQQSGLELEDGLVSTRRGAGIDVEQGRLLLRRVWLPEVPAGGVVLASAPGALFDLRVDGGPGGSAVHASDGRALHVERLASTGFQAGLRLVRTPATLRDLLITDLVSGDPLRPHSVGIQAIGAGPFRIERARIGGFLGHAVAIAAEGFAGAQTLPEEVTVEDLEVSRVSADLEGKGGVGFFEEGALKVDLRRVRCTQVSQRGLELRGFPRGTDLLVRDLHVEGARQGVERSGLGTSLLERIDIHDASDRAIELRGRPFMARSVRIRGRGGLRGVSIAPSNIDDGPIELVDFAITGPLGAAVVAEGGTRGIRLVNGEISNVDVAYGLPDEGETFETVNVLLRLGEDQRTSAVGVP